jgi:hypothetical protein
LNRLNEHQTVARAEFSRGRGSPHEREGIFFQFHHDRQGIVLKE